MKKTLAIFLALLAAASVTLASCGNKKKPLEQGGGGSYIDDEYDDDTTTNNDGSNTGDTGNNGNTGNNNVSDPTANFTDTNDIVYAGAYVLNLRTTPSENAVVVKTVPAKTKLNRSQTNGTWDKVTLDGDTNVYYVLNGWVTKNTADFDFVDCEDAAVTLKGTTGVQFFRSPFHAENGIAMKNALLEDAIVATDIEAGYTLKRVAMNSNWVKVTFTGTVNKSGKKYTAENETFYIQAKHFTNGRIEDPTFPGQGGSNNPGTGVG